MPVLRTTSRVGASHETKPRRRTKLPGLKARQRIGRTQLKVSPACLGLVAHPDVIVAAFRAGLNFFFLTADMHWPAYEATRQGLRALLRSNPRAREQIVVAVASYVTQTEFCSLPFQEVLDEVPELGHVDLAVIGGTYPTDFLVRLQEYRKELPGGASALGATFHDRTTAVTAVNHDLLDIAFIRYNSAHTGAERDVFPHLRRDRRVTLFNFLSTRGYASPQRLDELKVPSKNWRPTHADHYRFVLTAPQVDGVLCSLDSNDHVRELVDALAQGRLSPQEATYLKTLSRLDAGYLAVAQPTRKKKQR